MAKLYKDPRWKRKRLVVLKRDGYKCRECRRYGKGTQASVVHHVKPLEKNPELGMDSKNLISLCESCHNKMHDRDGDKLTGLGSEWARRIWSE